MNIMGVDPGFSGAIAIISDTGTVQHYCKMPLKLIGPEKKKQIDIARIAAMVAKFEPSHVFLERAQAMPKNGAVGMFNYGVGYGMILGLCLALEQLLATTTVPPRTWQKFMYSALDGVDDMEPKARAMARFYELWPSLHRDGVSHDGIIDAMLMAEYGRRMLSLN